MIFEGFMCMYIHIYKIYYVLNISNFTFTNSIN